MNKDELNEAFNYHAISKTYVPKGEFLGFGSSKTDRAETIANLITSFVTTFFKVIYTLLKKFITFITDVLKTVAKKIHLMDGLSSLFGDILQTNVKYGESSTITIQYIVDPNIIKLKLNYLDNLIKSRIKFRDGLKIKTEVDRLNGIMDPSITNNGKLLNENKIKEIVNNNIQFKQTIATLNIGYQKLFVESDPNGWSTPKTINCTLVADRKIAIDEYGRISVLYTDVLKLSQTYYTKVSKDIETMLRNIQTIEKHNGPQTEDEILFLNIIDPVITNVVQDIKNITEMTQWIQDMIVTNLTVLTNNSK